MELGQPMMRDASPYTSRKVLAVPFLLMGLGCALFLCTYGGVGQQQVPANMQLFGTTASQSMQMMKSSMMNAQANAMQAAASAVRSRGPSTAPQYASALKFAAFDGANVGCRGDRLCMRAVGLLFGTQTGKTEEAAGVVAEKTGLEAQDVGDMEAGDLAGFDGLIVGTPTWHTGADEQRSGVAWDDMLDNIRGLDLKGKPVAVFACGDSVGYGDNFCDAMEELHNTFEAAGAKMLGYTSSDGYQHGDTKSVKDGKFLGLALDQDNEDDMTPGRVDAWVSQLKSEGMPLA